MASYSQRIDSMIDELRTVPHIDIYTTVPPDLGNGLPVQGSGGLEFRLIKVVRLGTCAARDRGAAMSIPDSPSLMLPVLEAASKGEASVPLAEAEIAGRFNLHDEERVQLLPSEKRVLHNRIH